MMELTLNKAYVILMIFLVIIILISWIYEYKINSLKEELSILKGEHKFNSKDMIDLQLIGTKFKENHKYNFTEYNCVNYSVDFKTILDGLGYEADYVVGCDINNTNCHQWLTISFDYEPITGKFVNYKKEYPIIRDNTK